MKNKILSQLEDFAKVLTIKVSKIVIDSIHENKIHFFINDVEGDALCNRRFEIFSLRLNGDKPIKCYAANYRSYRNYAVREDRVFYREGRQDVE